MSVLLVPAEQKVASKVSQARVGAHGNLRGQCTKVFDLTADAVILTATIHDHLTAADLSLKLTASDGRTDPRSANLPLADGLTARIARIRRSITKTELRGSSEH